MITVTNTLKGVQGYVANPQSVGIRVSKEGVAAARAALQHPSVQITTSNQNVAGTLRYVARGFPLNISAPAIVKCLAAPADGSEWKQWNVIPYKSIVQGATRTWYLKADVAPSHNRLILPEGWKITLCAEPTTQETFIQKTTERQKELEKAKEKRRQRIQQDQQNPPRLNFSNNERVRESQNRAKLLHAHLVREQKLTRRKKQPWPLCKVKLNASTGE